MVAVFRFGCSFRRAKTARSEASPWSRIESWMKSMRCKTPRSCRPERGETTEPKHNPDEVALLPQQRQVDPAITRVTLTDLGTEALPAYAWTPMRPADSESAPSEMDWRVESERMAAEVPAAIHPNNRICSPTT